MLGFKHVLLQKGKEPPAPSTLAFKNPRGPFQPQPFCNSVGTEHKPSCSSTFRCGKRNPSAKTNKKKSLLLFIIQHAQQSQSIFQHVILPLAVSRGILQWKSFRSAPNEPLSLYPLSHSVSPSVYQKIIQTSLLGTNFSKLKGSKGPIQGMQWCPSSLSYREGDRANPIKHRAFYRATDSPGSRAACCQREHQAHRQIFKIP